MKTSLCPFCGRLIVRDDKRMKVSHQAPTCDGFLELLKKHRPDETFLEQIRVPERPKQ